MTVALVRYLGADLLRSQRFLLPVLLVAVVLAILFGGDPGPPPGTWVASVLALYPAATWLAVTVAHTEDRGQRLVTVAAAGGHGRLAAGVLATCLVCDGMLVALAVAWPVVATPYPHSPAMLAAGVLAHLAATATGTAVGLLCARPVITGIGWTAVLGVGVVVLTAVQPWLPPVGAAARALGTDPVPLGALAGFAALGLGLATGAAAITAVVARHR